MREVVFLELENELMELRELHEKDREEGLMNCFLNQPEVDVLPEEELIQEVKSRRFVDFFFFFFFFFSLYFFLFFLFFFSFLIFISLISHFYDIFQGKGERNRRRNLEDRFFTFKETTRRRGRRGAKGSGKAPFDKNWFFGEKYNSEFTGIY